MKMSKILTAVGLAAAVMAFSSCAFGKDDFFGTWTTSYDVTEDNASTGNESVDGTTVDCNNSKYLDSHVELSMYFDGKSENLFNTTEQDSKENKFKSAFWQYKIRTRDESVKGGVRYEAINKKSFYCGSYELQDNANYTRGTLVLDYMYGFIDVNEERAMELADIWTGAKEVPAEEGIDPKAKDAIAQYFYKHANVKTVDGEDIETFDFELTGASLLNGYTKMSAKAKKGCDWEVSSRSFDLQGTDGSLSAVIDILTGAKTPADGE